MGTGGVYMVTLGGAYQYEHGYEFDGSDGTEGTYTVTVRDAVAPTLTLSATVQGGGVGFA